MMEEHQRRYPLIVIVIPTYNSRYTLPMCLEALINLDYPKKRLGIIFIDGGSKDGTIEFLKEWSIKYNQTFNFIKIILLGKRGVSMARNVGLREAINSEAEYILMVDSDIVIPKHFIKTAMIHFDNEDTLCVVSAPVSTEKPHLFEMLNLARQPYPYGYVEVAPPGVWLISSKCVHKVGYFNEKLGYPHSDWEQAEYSARIRGKGLKLIVDWRLKSLHIKQKDYGKQSKGITRELLKMLVALTRRYLLFLPHIWHEMVKARPRYYIPLTLAHLVIPISLILSIIAPLVLLYPLIIFFTYMVQILRKRSPVKFRYKILASIGLMYMRSLIAMGYVLYLAKVVFRKLRIR